MKNVFFLLIFLSSGFLYSQSNLPDYSDFKSIVRPLPNPYKPTGVQSTIYTVNGFDNFYLGNDNSEPYIAVNPNDPLNMICAYNSPSATASDIYITQNGYDWARTYPSYNGLQGIGDPVVTFDSLGNMYFMEITQLPYGSVILKSTNKGVNWLSPVQPYIIAGGLCDKPWMTCDQSAGPYSNYLYIGCRYFGSGGGMKFVRSTDKGVTWSSPMTLSGDQGAYLCVGPNGNIPGGNLYYACNSGGSIILYKSTDGGVTLNNTGTNIGFTGPGVICYGRYTMKNCIRTDIFPRMAADNSWTSTRGNLYIVYATNPVGPDLADIYLVKSTNYGQSWGTPIRVNDDATTTDQWMPAITVDKKTGRIFVFWYDSRNDPSGNLLTELYGATSTDGGTTFTANTKISNASFNPNVMAFGSNDALYMGDYIGNAGIGITSINTWMDDRANSTGLSQSFVGYNPDFAMTTSSSDKTIGNNDSAFIYVSVPAIKGIYNDKVKFTCALDTLPTSGTISFSFVNGKDTITSFPDSVRLRIKTIGSISPSKNYHVQINGAGSNGTPVHRRILNLLVNSQLVTIQSNRNGICNFKVNGITYNTTQQFVFQNSSVVNVAAVSPQGSGGTRYVFKNWSDNGDTTHNITINSSFTLTVNYKPQYILILNSEHGIFVGDGFHDSASTFIFGVYPRIVKIGGGIGYQFHGWDGAGNGSYTSPDTLGFDTLNTITISNPIVETARWTQIAVGINNISSEIPDKYQLYQNYPNPFNPSTVINFDVIKSGIVKISIFDVLGKELKVLTNDFVNPGKYKVIFNGENFASGIYYYTININDFTFTKKMLIIK
jgi:hypothetical protein